MKNSFRLIVLGCTGGPLENNLSGYLVSPINSSECIVLDAGALLGGLKIALEKGSFNDISLEDPSLSPLGVLFLKHIKAYLISHAHLDHISALIHKSQVDCSKPILGMDPTIDHMRDYLFNGKIWPNYGSEGVEPIVGLYRYIRLKEGRLMEIPGTKMRVESFFLNHPKKYLSSAFLIELEGEYLLYFGDTSSDSVEENKRLEVIWKRIAPLIQKKQLHALFLECSYPTPQGHQTLYGHLDPDFLMWEMQRLKDLVGNAPTHLKIIITHRKETPLRSQNDGLFLIEEELTKRNTLGLQFIFPQQGDKILL